MKKSVSLLFAAAMISLPAFAQDDNAKDCLAGENFSFSDECLKSEDLLGALDLAAPQNSLMALSGLTPETIIKPKKGDKLALSYLPQVTDALGNEQYSIGFEVNPGLLMMPERFTMAEYMGTATSAPSSQDRVRKINRARMLSAISISGFAAKSTEGGFSSKYGLGISYQHDEGASFRAQGRYGDCVREAYTINGVLEAPSKIIGDLESEVKAENGTHEPNGNPINRDRWEIVEEAERRFEDKYKPEDVVTKCAAAASPWNRKVIGAGAAILRSEASVTETGQTMPPAMQEGLDKTGVGIWASYAGESPLDKKNGQVSIGAKWTDNLVRTRKDGDESITETVDGWQVGGRYTQNMAEKKTEKGVVRQSYRAFAEVAYAEERFGGMTDKFTQAGVGIEVQVGKNYLFQAVFGDTFGSDIHRGTYLSGQVKWTFSSIR